MKRYTFFTVTIIAALALQLNAQITLDLKVFLEGPFNGTTMNTILNAQSLIPLSQPYNVQPWKYYGAESVTIIPNLNVVDWVLVEILEQQISGPDTSFMIRARKAAFILNDGTVKDLDGLNLIQFSGVSLTTFHIRVLHRNHVPVTSSETLTNVEGIYYYDFTTGSGKTIGGLNGQNEIATGIWGMIAGDGDANFQVNNLDKDDIWLVQQGSTGYNRGDYNLDGLVDDNDNNINWEQNGGKGINISIITPPNQPPDPPSDLNPPSGAINQPINTALSWICTDPENDPLIFDIFFGTINPPPGISYGQSSSTINLGLLEFQTTYYWKVVVRDTANNISESPVFSFETEEQMCGSTLFDERDGQVYNIVQLGNQCWMAENLNIGTMVPGTNPMGNNGIIEKYCYNNETMKCYEYGGLYRYWEALNYTYVPPVQGICPFEWHIPIQQEWCMLAQYLDPTVNCNNYGYLGLNAGYQMKSTSGWSSGGNGSNSSGFNALPGGDYQKYSSYPPAFMNLFNVTNFWGGFDPVINTIWSLNYASNGISHSMPPPGNIILGLSVRCVKALPNMPSNPSPPDGSQNQSINTSLDWTIIDPVNVPLNYDVYFGTTTPLFLVSEGQSENSYNPSGELNLSTTYYWQIIVNDNNGNHTPGSLWSFSTGFKPCPGIETVEYEGQTYHTVQIGSQCWLQENLNVGTMITGSENQSDNAMMEKYCYDDDESNCDTYGGLYQWNEMMKYNFNISQGICPPGWKVPNDAEWCTLEWTIDPTTICGNTGFRGTNGGEKMKASGSLWNPPGINESGFTALPGGARSAGGTFLSMSIDAIFWSSTLSEDYHYWVRWLDKYDNRVNRVGEWWPSGYSIRCLKN